MLVFIWKRIVTKDFFVHLRAFLWLFRLAPISVH